MLKKSINSVDCGKSDSLESGLQRGNIYVSLLSGHKGEGIMIKGCKGGRVQGHNVERAQGQKGERAQGCKDERTQGQKGEMVQ